MNIEMLLCLVILICTRVQYAGLIGENSKRNSRNFISLPKNQFGMLRTVELENHVNDTYIMLTLNPCEGGSYIIAVFA